MGKDSLIKSTSKKKAGAKKDEEKKATKKPAAKTTAKKKTAAAASAKKKTSAKKTTSKKAAPKKTQKTAAAPTAKKAAPKKTAAKKPAKKAPVAKAKKTSKPKASPKPAKKLTVKELIFKKFEPLETIKPVTAGPKRRKVVPAAPPYISTDDPNETKRLHALLMKQFSMDAVKAAAREPLPEPAVTDKTSEQQASTPERAETAAPQAEAKAPPEDNAYITVEPPEDKTAPDPVSRAAKTAAAVAAAVVFLLLAISYNNSSKYYIYPKDNAIEIWKGRFSPKDSMFYMVLHGVELEGQPAAVYSSAEVFPLIFDYYLDKADTLLEVPGLPDFEGIKTYLHQAEAYAVDAEMKTAVASRLNNLERMILMYKAEVAMSKGTVDSLQQGIKLLKQADRITATELQSQEIIQKIEAARDRITTLEAATE